MKYARSQADTETAFEEQREFIRRSCTAYDDGMFGEARRLATAIYLVVFDGGKRSQSLLTQLGITDLKFVSSLNPLKENMWPKLALANVCGLPGGRFEVIPHCAHPEKIPPLTRVTRSAWWNEVIFQQSIWRGEGVPIGIGQTFTRKNLVFHLRTQDGGAHFDPNLANETYIDFAISKKIGMYKQNADGQSVPFVNPHLASMRQIAWELEETLRGIPGGPVLPDLEPFPPKPYRIADQSYFKPDTITIIPPEAS